MEVQLFLNGITIDQLATALKEALGQKNEIKIAPSNESNDLITREEACKLLSVSKTTLWNHTRCGKLKSYGMGNRVYYKKSEVLNSLQTLNI